MRYLCLIYLDEKPLAAMPQAEMDALNARHLALNEDLGGVPHPASSKRTH